ncbi:hypothetical protein Arub01_10510 [Actinomadura rubrobrunea]|uniref:Uncharacterized protein n=1 Tax=Actinomadura rubrobrunea TaxID=115335 RepID=A0A9W6UV15_9ACTN|nr:hypothetical protein Arub01_10510 [Actinomadura rubrobrunea]
MDLMLPDLSPRLQADHGMFSPDRVDAGMRILLESAPPSGRPFDIGFILCRGPGDYCRTRPP